MPGNRRGMSHARNLQRGVSIVPGRGEVNQRPHHNLGEIRSPWAIHRLGN